MSTKQTLVKLLNEAGYQVSQSDILDAYQEHDGNFIFICEDDNDTYSVSRWFTKAKDFGANNLIEDVTEEVAQRFFNVCCIQDNSIQDNQQPTQEYLIKSASSMLAHVIKNLNIKAGKDLQNEGETVDIFSTSHYW